MRTIDLSDKTALIVGIANQRSLAWAIAQSLGQAGCKMAFTYQSERLRDKVSSLVAAYEGSPLIECDVTEPDQVKNVFATVEREFGKLSYLIHSVAFARREELEGDFRHTSLEGWRLAQEISAYSFVDLTNRAVPLMEPEGGHCLALTYMASQKVVPHYNVMGSAKAALEHAVRQLAFELGPQNIRVNAISAGPIATISSRGVSGFSQMASHHRERAPLLRTVEAREVGDSALFLCSELGSGITGEILYVDAGYNIMAG